MRQVSEATSIEQETVEHALPEIQTAENQPQEFSEEKSREYQVCYNIIKCLFEDILFGFLQINRFFFSCFPF